MLRTKSTTAAGRQDKMLKHQRASARGGETGSGTRTPEGLSPSREVLRRSEPLATYRRYSDSIGEDGYSDSGKIYCEQYQAAWTRVTTGCMSGIAFVLVVAVLYALYVLCSSYIYSVGCAVVLSIALHPNRCGGESRNWKGRYIERMRSTREKWTGRSRVFGLLGSLLSLTHFFRYALGRGVAFSGVDKLLGRAGKRGRKFVKICDPSAGSNSGKDSKLQQKPANVLPAGDANSLKWQEESTLSCILLVVLICFVAHLMFGILLFLGIHSILIALFIITVPFMTPDRFMSVMWRVWLLAITVFFFVGFSYNVALDVISISDVVKQTTSVVVEAGEKWTGGVKEGNRTNVAASFSNGTAASSSSFAEFVNMTRSKLNKMFLQELAYAMNHTNATELALTVQHAVSPLMSSLSSDISVRSLLKNGGNIRGNFAQLKKLYEPVVWTDVAQKLMERWQELFVYANQLLMKLGSNVLNLFDSVYAVMLLFVVMHHLLQLEHTVLYYILAKLLKVLDPQCGEYHARKIETEITNSFHTLLQSFWHKACFRFCITFCLFKCWSFPTPLLFGVVSAVIALLPLAPKWISPVALTFMYKLFCAAYGDGFAAALADPCLWCCFLAFCATYMDERLLCVSQGFLDDRSSVASAPGQWKLPTAVISTALVLGFFQYGVCGIFLGPMTVVLAKVLYDNWDTAME